MESALTHAETHTYFVIFTMYIFIQTPFMEETDKTTTKLKSVKGGLKSQEKLVIGPLVNVSPWL